MSRMINQYEENPITNAIALKENVDVDELRKKYMESVEHGNYKPAEQNIEELQSEYDGYIAQELMEFFGVDLVLSSDGSEALEQLAEEIEKVAQDEMAKADADYEKYVAQDAEDGMMQVSVEDIAAEVVSDDPFLEKQFKEERNRLLNSLFDKEDKEEVINKRETINNTSSSFSRERTGYEQRNNSYRTTTASSTSSFTKPVEKVDEKEAEYRKRLLQQMYHTGSDKMRRMASRYEDLAEVRHERMQRKGRKIRRRKGFKGYIDIAKNWFRSRDARVVFKVGMMLCMETALGVISGQFEFEGPGQTLTYILMMLGVFYIARELASEGLDPRETGFA